VRKPKYPLQCPKNPEHDTFIAKMKVSEEVILDRRGMVMDTRKLSKHIKPERCAVCHTHLVKWETHEEIAVRYIKEFGLEKEEGKSIEDFDLDEIIEDICCGLCSNLYDMCDCAETGMR
jgi:hypothetical protein